MVYIQAYNGVLKQPTNLLFIQSNLTAIAGYQGLFSPPNGKSIIIRGLSISSSGVASTIVFGDGVDDFLVIPITTAGFIDIDLSLRPIALPINTDFSYRRGVSVNIPISLHIWFEYGNLITAI